MPQPLPNNPFPAGTPAHQAYTTCQTMEAGFPLVNWSGPPTSVCARLLGYLTIHAPTVSGRTDVTNEINCCNNDEEKLHTLAQFYINHFLRVFRQNKGRTPVPSGHVSRPSFDDMQATLMYLLVEPPKNYTDSKNGALVRDGYRCVITGAVDLASAQQYPNQLTALGATHGFRITNYAHILTPSTSQDISGDKAFGAKHEYAASAWAVICRMGGILVVDELNGNGSHRLENVMTMEMGLHGLFDSLSLWFEATNIPNQYTLHSVHPFVLANLPQTVTFTAQNNLPLPSQRYLALHAACAKVAHLSGAGEYIDAVDRDIDTTRVLARDGSSAGVLADAMTRIGITA